MNERDNLKLKLFGARYSMKLGEYANSFAKQPTPNGFVEPLSGRERLFLNTVEMLIADLQSLESQGQPLSPAIRVSLGIAQAMVKRHRDSSLRT